MRERDVAEADRCDQPVITRRDHRRKLVVEERIRPVISHQPEVDDGELVDSERPEIVFDAATQLRRFVGDENAAPAVPTRSDLAHQRQLGWIRVEGFTDELVDDVRPVVLGSVDVVDATVDRGAQQSDRVGAIVGRPEHVRPSESHRSESNGGDHERAQRTLLHGPTPFIANDRRSSA